jgi:hypothetical protein
MNDEILSFYDGENLDIVIDIAQQTANSNIFIEVLEDIGIM